MRPLERHGASGRLVEDFRALAEATTMEGLPRYAGEAILRKLARFLVGQGGGPNRDAPLYELCHLVSAVDAAGDARDRRNCFFLEPRRPLPELLRRSLEDALGQGGWRRPGFSLTEDGVVVAFDGSSFCVRFGRMPFLVAVYEFLAGMEGPEGEESAYFTHLNRIFDAMAVGEPGPAAIKSAANEISRHLRSYRNRHLSWAEHEEKFNALIRFLRSDEEDIRIDDRSVLAFWLSQSANPKAGDFRRFRSVFDAFVKLIEALETAGLRRAAESAAPIGTDYEKGEVEPEDVGTDFDLWADWESPLPILARGQVAGINFLKKKSEQAPLKLLMTYGPWAERLPLSLLRAEVFGAIQSAITVDRQFKKGGTALEQRLSCREAETYRRKEACFRRLLQHLRKALLASYHVVRDPAADSTLDPSDIPPESIAAIAEQASDTFRTFGRRGFTEMSLDDPDLIEGFHTAADALLAMVKVLQGFLDRMARLDQGDPDLDGWFDRDRQIFRDQFRKLYGVAP